MTFFEIKAGNVDVGNLTARIMEKIGSNGDLFRARDEMEGVAERIFGSSDACVAKKSLKFINANYRLKITREITSHRFVVGKFLVRIRRLLHDEILRSVESLVRSQTLFNQHLASLINMFYTKTDTLEEKIENLTKKIEEQEKTIEELRKELSRGAEKQ